MGYQHLNRHAEAIARAERRLANAVDHVREAEVRGERGWRAWLGWPFSRARADDEMRVAKELLREARASASLAARSWVAEKARELLLRDAVARSQHAAAVESHADCVRITHRARRWETLARQADVAVHMAMHALDKAPDTGLLALARDGMLGAAGASEAQLAAWNAVRQAEKAMMTLALALGVARPAMDTEFDTPNWSVTGALETLMAPTFDYLPLLSLNSSGDLTTSCHEARARIVPVIQRLTEVVAENSDREQWTAAQIKRLERPFRERAEKLLPRGLQGPQERNYLGGVADLGCDVKPVTHDSLARAT
ncbi:hypothetical protein [Acidovorax sp.]|uniref:hypothetical protein n=1 Tax=Acidovorax sp. TaxID=1872122 RepID=UPI00391F6966